MTVMRTMYTESIDKIHLESRSNPKAMHASPILATLPITVARFISAEPTNSTRPAIDLSGLSGEDQGQANVTACLVECNRDETLDVRYERVRYDHYYVTKGGFVLSDSTDPDS